MIESKVKCKDLDWDPLFDTLVGCLGMDIQNKSHSPVPFQTRIDKKAKHEWKNGLFQELARNADSTGVK